MKKQPIIIKKEYIIIKKNNIATTITEICKLTGILFILTINHYKLDDSFFGALTLTILFLITYSKLKPTTNKYIKTIKGKNEMRQYIKSQLNK